MDRVDKNFLIVQSNSLIEKKKFLSLDEQKIVLIFASLINPEDEEFKTYTVEANKIMSLLEVKNKSKYAALKETIYSLASKPIKFEKENNKGFTIMQWFSYADYEDGVLKVKFTEELKPYLLGLKELFTKYKLENILHMKSKYSVQLYELLKSNEFKKEICLDVEDLRSVFNLGDKYNRYNDFKKRTILKAHEEVNGKTDLNFEFEEIREGKNIKAIKFIISSKKTCPIDIQEDIVEIDLETKIKIDTLKNIIGQNLEDRDYQSILESSNGDIAKIIEKYYLIKDKKDITNIVGLLIDAVKNDYKELKIENENKKKQKTKFHNFDERFEKYSEKELEQLVIESQKKKFGA